MPESVPGSMKEASHAELAASWERREKSGARARTEALRMFHGPGEGRGPLRAVAIDLFGAHAWVTAWEEILPGDRQQVGAFLEARGVHSAVWLHRSLDRAPAQPAILFGEPPSGRFEVREGKARFLIQLLGTQHPGLFLDHAPLRSWLADGGSGRFQSVLNTFAYTGSLSVAAGLGGAERVTTLDLSKPTLEWARANWMLNGLAPDAGDFIFGDCFEWLPKFAKRKNLFDCVILDPPSFSRGKKGSFSTAKDLARLHELAFSVLAPQGILVTSINSANVARERFFEEVQNAARAKGRSISVVSSLELPPTFPAQGADRYLKGWILRSS